VSAPTAPSVNKHGGYFMCWNQKKADGSVPRGWMKMALSYAGWKTVVLFGHNFLKEETRSIYFSILDLNVFILNSIPK
jgi:hypothetical protein